MSTMYNKCNNEHYDIEMSDKIIFCKDRSTGYNFKKNGTQDLVPSFSRTDCLNCRFFLTALLKNGIVYQIILEKIIIIYNYL